MVKHHETLADKIIIILKELEELGAVILWWRDSETDNIKFTFYDSQIHCKLREAHIIGACSSNASFLEDLEDYAKLLRTE